MLFSSTIFIFGFLPLVLFIYYAFLRKTTKAKNIFLFLASLFFYAWGEPRYIILLVFSIIINWLFGLAVDKYRDNKIKSKLFLVLMAMSNISLLVVFKYLGFILNNINSLFNANIIVPEIKLPIGVSFFTFQAISYVVDVYRKNGKVQKNIMNVGLYLSFFPQLIAGPIVRYETISEQIENRKETIQGFSKGVYRFLIGLFKKVLISNQMAMIADVAFDNGPTSIMFAWLGAIAYMIQIYFDFSGYSDMAIGLGKMFGFEFNENFNYPYIAKSVTDFWRRWHISLSTWFRDYVYIPLGGSKCSKNRAFFNMFIVWLLTGIWHGASWNFIIWGLFYFIVLFMEKSILKDRIKEVDNFHWLWRALLRIYTITVVLFGWIIFRSSTLSDIGLYVKSMFGLTNLPFTDINFVSFFDSKLVYLIFGIVFSFPLFPKIEKIIDKNKIVSCIIFPICFACAYLLTISFLVKGTYNPFIYFNF